MCPNDIDKIENILYKIAITRVNVYTFPGFGKAYNNTKDVSYRKNFYAEKNVCAFVRC